MARPVAALLAAWLLVPSAVARAQTLLGSPDGRVAIAVDLKAGAATYHVEYRGKRVVEDSPLGLEFSDGKLAGLKLDSVDRGAHDETYDLPVGKASHVRDHYNEARLKLSDGRGRHVEIVARAYDDGAALRYVLPKQEAWSDFELTDEHTGVVLPRDATAWALALPGHGGHYEYPYQHSRVVDVKKGTLIGLPLLIEQPDGTALGLTEANLTDYAGMALDAQGDGAFRSSLTPLPGQPHVKVRGRLPFQSPWRVFLLADTAGKLIESNLVSNLSDPCAIKDTSWIRPGKVLFLWWNGYLVGPNARRGAVDTATFRSYVDAAAELGLPYSSIDGLDVAWYGGRIPGYGENDITVPVKELDIQNVLARAKQKGTRIRLWVASQGMRKYLNKALDTYEKWGVEGVMVDFIERDDQESVRWVRELVEKAAAHHLTVTLHNVPKPTGLSRTFPNLLTYESVRNQEWDKWDPVGVTPTHNLTVPFVRMLAGPLDYHQGGFRSVRVPEYRPRDVAPEVMGTRCHQLAMYVVYEDPMPMAVDYPAAYRGQPGWDFVRDVPTTWDETRFLAGQVGQYIAVARRKGEVWYVGTMTDERPREVRLPLSFLADGTYRAEVWADDIPNGVNALSITTREVRRGDTLVQTLAPAGGQVVRVRRAAD